MRVFLLIDNLGSGGAQRQLTTLAVLLKKRGYEVSLIVYDKDDFFRLVLDENKIPVIELFHSTQIKRALAVRRYIRSQKPDAVISFMDTPNFFNCIAAVGGHKWKVITSERSCQETIFKSSKNKLFNYFQKYSDAIVCNSERARQMWLSHKSQFSFKMHVIYNTVKTKPIVSEYIPLRDGKIHIVVAASFQTLKNPENVAKALCNLEKSILNHIQIDWYGQFRLTSDGSSPYEKTKWLIDNNELKDVFILHGPSNDIAEIMVKADYIALFSQFEGLPNAICEGMMLGKPIIMTKVSDYSKLVDGKNGFLCEWDDLQSISQVITTASKMSKEEIQEMGMYSKELATRMFENDAVLKQWTALFK